MNRKEFLLSSALAAFSISTFGRVAKTTQGFAGDCETTNDILGPFYRPDAPVRQQVVERGTDGNGVHLIGRVFAADCITPIKNALVEIWHCDTKGEYDNETEAFQLRARWYTDENGAYSFKTILPGKYLNGGQFRPAHIHFRVSAEGRKELISQIYFAGDPHIEKDPWASQEKAVNRILPIQLAETDGSLTVQFDINLQSA